MIELPSWGKEKRTSRGYRNLKEMKDGDNCYLILKFCESCESGQIRECQARKWSACYHLLCDFLLSRRRTSRFLNWNMNIPKVR